MVQVEYPDSSVSFTYDPNGNRTSMQDSNSSAVYAYDSRNRIISETRTIDEVEYSISYAYDAASHLISLTYPDGIVVEQTYDNVGRVSSINGYAEYLWNETQLQQITYANDVFTTYNYDARGRLTQIHTQKNGGDLLNLTYTYDAVGNILQMKSTENANGQQIIKEQWDYTYDSLNRLRTAVGNSYSFTCAYDSTGNRTQLNNTTYSYNEMNELISAGGEGGTFTFEYDEYGNCIQKSDGTKTWEYIYDSENRLTSVKVEGVVTEEYLYDGDGNRIEKTDSSSERIYIYNGMNVLYEVNTTTQMHAVYIYGPTGRIAKKVNDIAEYYHEDHLGSTRLVTTENGVVTEEIMYEPFGDEINTSEERYTYNGKERDETGLYYYGARYYDPAVGRFISRDPLTGKKESPQTLNRYSYCLNNPLKYIDPAGTQPEPQEIVEAIFDRLLDIDPETYAELQKQVESGAITALDALIKILELMGYRVDEVNSAQNSLRVVIEGGLSITMKLDSSLKDYGQFDVLTQTASINFEKTRNVADMALIAAHEISHAVLCATTDVDTTAQEPIIYAVEFSYANVLWWSGVGYSREYIDHLGYERRKTDPQGVYNVPVSRIMEKWIKVQGWERCQI